MLASAAHSLALPPIRPTPLRELEEAIRAVEWGRGGGGGGDGGASGTPPLPTGWLDDLLSPYGSLSGLPRGCVHEWCGVDHAAPSAPAQASTIPPRPSVGSGAGMGSAGSGGWFPPLSLMVHLAWQAIDDASGAAAVAGGRIGAASADPPPSPGRVVWIGRRSWPYAHALVRRIGSSLDRRLLDASLFVDPPDDAARVWAIDLALRAGGGGGGGDGSEAGDGGVALVIADASRLDMASSRRLQLAAEAGARAAASCGTPRIGGIGLLLRPPAERRQLSASATRWLVRAAERAPPPTASRSGMFCPRWTVELLRCKGVQPPPDGRREWTLELDRARRVVCLLPSMVDRPAAPARAAV